MTEIPKELKPFLDGEGRLKQFPSNRQKKKLALTYLASQFENDRAYTEKEVNAILDEWHTFHDRCLLRRELYDGYFLGRERDGSRYWREDPQSKQKSSP